MRDRARQRAMAEAKSHRATAEELRDAGKRVKELEQELLTTIQLQPETTQGEDRRQRYSRLLRLRAMRDDFTSGRPLEADHPNGFHSGHHDDGRCLHALRLLCRRCPGRSAGAELQAQPDRYRHCLLAECRAAKLRSHPQQLALPTLWSRLRRSFADLATQASDTYYGPVTSFTLIRQGGDMTQSATLTYSGDTRHQQSLQSYVGLWCCMPAAGGE